MKNSKGFTLIELLITISLIVMITAVLYFTLTSALSSWAYSRDRLSIQKVLQETMDTVVNGPVGSYGLKDSLQIISASKTDMTFVPPWVDDSHSVATPEFVYTLNKMIKPGAPLPIAQVQIPDTTEWKIAPVTLVQLEETDDSQVQLNLLAPEGSGLRFIFHPDPETQPEVVHRFYFDSIKKKVLLENGNETIDISQNMFGVEILNMELNYYTNTNQLVTDRVLVDEADIPVITGVEILLEARMNQEVETLKSFISLRNAPMRTGYLSLRRGLKVRIPDSKKINTLMVTNLTGIKNNDRIQLEANPASGKSWLLSIFFEKIGGANPTIAKLIVEYPAGTPVYTDYPKTSAELGLNLKLLGTDGLFDYDDDTDVEDAVLLEGDVELTVKEMNLKGAGLFVRP